MVFISKDEKSPQGIGAESSNSIVHPHVLVLNLVQHHR